LGPFELRDDRVFGRCNEHGNIEQAKLCAATKLLTAERAVLSNDEVHLPPRRIVDDVEPLPERVSCGIQFDVVFVGGQSGHEGVERVG
jgi:hypothetical protein